MTRFAFTILDEDFAHLSELLRVGVGVVVDIDPEQGGIFMTHEQASMTWTWIEEINSDGSDNDDVEPFTDAVEAVEAALSAAASSFHKSELSTSPSLDLEVSQHHLELLSSLEKAGFDICLSLDPHGGGIDAVHASGKSLKWSFISEIELEPEPEGETDQDDVSAMMLAFKLAIRA